MRARRRLAALAAFTANVEQGDIYATRLKGIASAAGGGGLSSALAGGRGLE